VYRSSAWGERRFCPRCGTQIEFRLAESPQFVEVNYVTLDSPETITPQMHIWYSRRLPWFEVKDDLPRYGEDQT
jgi:hypothetical protein